MSTTATPSSAPRLVSLDALRGFDMFWILGADALVVAFGALTQFAPIRLLAAQLEHKEWEGFGFYDLIFPLFVFVVGVSAVFSLRAQLSRDSRGKIVGRILRRAALLFLLGIFYNGGLTDPWPAVRIAGVLQRIAIAYAVTALLFCYFKPRTLAVITAGLLLGYWALLTFVPIRAVQLDRAALVQQMPGVTVDAEGYPDEARVRTLFEQTTARVTGHFDPGLNFANHLDYLYLPGTRYDHYYDPEGLLSTLPAVATCLLGVFAALLLQRIDLTPIQKCRALWLTGAGLLLLGWCWHHDLPVIKKLWTSSYVLVAGGWSFLLLGTFYFLIDVRGWQRWCRPFVWIGMNPITLYLLSSVVSFHAIAARLTGGSIQRWLDRHVVDGAGQVLVGATALLLVFAIARFLHARKIFLRV